MVIGKLRMVPLIKGFYEFLSHLSKICVVFETLARRVSNWI